MKHRKAERRLCLRIPLCCKVQFKLFGAGQTYYGQSTNISAGGIAFESDYQAKPGDLLELILTPPMGSKISPLDALVEVTRMTPVPMGRAKNITARCEIAGCIKEVRA